MMNAAITAPSPAEYHPDDIAWAAQEFNKSNVFFEFPSGETTCWHPQELNEPPPGQTTYWCAQPFEPAVWKMLVSKPYSQPGVRYRVFMVDRRSLEIVDHRVSFIQYGSDEVLADFGEPITAFPTDHQETVEYLRTHGRPVLAEKLVTLLQNVNDDPDEPPIYISSLRDMARCLVEHKGFADPSIGLGRRGMVYAQWRIMGDGVLVVSFLGHDEVLLVAQASRGGCPLDISESGRSQDIVKEHEDLVPRRN